MSAAVVISVNVGSLRDSPAKSRLRTGIGKSPTGAVDITVPSADGISGVAGDEIGDAQHHGGVEQAVYAYAVEDYDFLRDYLPTPRPAGLFGENLTVSGVDVTGAIIGERWQIGDGVILQVTCPRIPCSTFTAVMGRRGWAKTFTQAGRPGAYLSVLAPGVIKPGDPIRICERPDHSVDIGVYFRALTIERSLAADVMRARDYLSATGIAELGRGFAI
jgi:MOSC domain-containing protein YiiM